MNDETKFYIGYNYKSPLFVKTNGYKLLFCTAKCQIALHLVSNIFHR